jgi:hypothetical protein
MVKPVPGTVLVNVVAKAGVMKLVTNASINSSAGTALLITDVINALFFIGLHCSVFSDDIEENPFVILRDIGEVIRKTAEIIANSCLQIIADVIVNGGKGAKPR